MKVNYLDVKEDYQRLNAQISELEYKLEKSESRLVDAESALSKAGYRRCDTLCNCGGYHKSV